MSNDGELKHREYIEWVNWWWEESANKDKKRLLLIGDSVARQFRGNFNNMCTEKYGMAVDFPGTSASVRSDLLLREIKSFFDACDYKYEMILLQVGHHGYRTRCKADEAEAELFAENYELLLDYLAEKVNGNIIVLANTPVANDESKNEEIRIRNDISKKVAGERGEYPYFDMYSLMAESDFVYTDDVHFERSADLFIAEKILAFLEEGKYFQ